MINPFYDQLGHPFFSEHLANYIHNIKRGMIEFYRQNFFFIQAYLWDMADHHNTASITIVSCNLFPVEDSFLQFVKNVNSIKYNKAKCSKKKKGYL